MGYVTVLLASIASCAAVSVWGAENARGDVSKGRAIATQTCAACHGLDGNSVMPANPSLAGQHAKYTEKQLVNFKSQERKNVIMLGMAATLSAEDVKHLGAYFEAQKPALNVARDQAAVESGERVYRGGVAESALPACSGCHGPDGSGIPARYPRLAGQQKDYTVAQLKSFRSGERANDESKIMRMIAARLSDEQIGALAEYIAGLR